MNKKMIVFNVTPVNTDCNDLDTFEKNVKKAKKMGATHIHVTEIEKSTWIWEKDLSDPYPNWGMLNAALFKIMIPEPLKPYLPQEYADHNLALIKKKVEICRKHGLKSAGQFCEPFYLPEQAYRDHPQWRGPRCDHPRRAKDYYYSPCSDHPEILQMYQQTMEDFCNICDLDYLFLFTNDSGSGMCWSNGLYPGPNGPQWCKDIPMEKRVITFLDALKEGAKKAGRQLYIETNSNIGIKEKEHEMDRIWSHLDDDHMAVNFKTNQKKPLSSLADINYEFVFSPVKNIPMVWRFLEQLEKGWHEPSQVLRVVFYDDDFDWYFRTYEKFIENPTNGITDRVQLLTQLATEDVGKENAQKLVGCWEQIEMGVKHFFDTYIEGFSWTAINQRLINRPFVLFPFELSSEEKDYYRKYQFQANSEDHADDLLDNQNTAFIRGYYAIFIASKNLEKTMDCVDRVQKIYEGFAHDQPQEQAQGFALGMDRLSLLNCFIKNYIHAMKFQDIIDTTDYFDPPQISAKWPIEGEEKGIEYDLITRAEIDNTYQIISLIKSREHTMLSLAPTKEKEDVFWLSPEITQQLDKKAQIMLDHQLDGKRLFVTHSK